MYHKFNFYREKINRKIKNKVIVGAGRKMMKKVRIKDIDLANTNYMSRLGFNDVHISNLAENMRKFGQRNPIGLRQMDKKYQVIYGWCRTKAALLLGWETIEARTYEGLSDLQAQLHNVSDNATHENLSTLEIAYQVKKLREDFKVSVKEIAQLYGDKTQYVYDLLTLTQMKPEIQQAVHGGKIGLSHAIEINKFPVSNQLEILEEAINEGLSTSKLKRMRSLRIQSEVVSKVSSRLSEKELEELAIQSEYRRFQKFLLNQVDAEAASRDGREDVVEDWISSLNMLRKVYGWKLTDVTERINTMMFTIVRARMRLEEECDVYKTPNELLLNGEMLRVTDLRRDKPSREMLGWLIREGARFRTLSCHHHWLSNENTGEHCIHCGIGRYVKLYWEDPPDEPPPSRGAARP